MTLGPYVVVASLRHDNPAFPRYLVYRGETLIGTQFSVPCLSDCRWLERNRGVYANGSKKDFRKYGRSSVQLFKRRSRPSEAEQREREAKLLAQIPTL